MFGDSGQLVLGRIPADNDSLFGNKAFVQLYICDESTSLVRLSLNPLYSTHPFESIVNSINLLDNFLHFKCHPYYVVHVWVRLCFTDVYFNVHAYMCLCSVHTSPYSSVQWIIRRAFKMDEQTYIGMCVIQSNNIQVQKCKHVTILTHYYMHITCCN